MAITNPTNVLNEFNTTNLGTYDTGVIVLTADRWYTISAHAYSLAGGQSLNSVTHDPLGTPRSFTLIPGAAVAWNSRRLEVWAIKPAVTTDSALIRLAWAGTQSASGWILNEWSAGVDPTTFAQQVVINSGTASTSSSVDMSSFTANDNATFFITGLGTGAGAPGKDLIAGEGRIELAENDETERAEHQDSYQNPNGGDTSLNSSWTGAMDWGAIGIEVKAIVTAAGPSAGRHWTLLNKSRK